MPRLPPQRGGSATGGVKPRRPRPPPARVATPHPVPSRPRRRPTFPRVLDLVCVEELHEHLEGPCVGLADSHTQQGWPGPTRGPSGALPECRGRLLLQLLWAEEGALKNTPRKPLPRRRAALTWVSRSRACTIFLRSQRLRAVTMATWPCTHSSFCRKRDTLVEGGGHSPWGRGPPAGTEGQPTSPSTNSTSQNWRLSHSRP